MDNAQLCHYGVLGMKWGKRRAQNNEGVDMMDEHANPICQTTELLPDLASRSVLTEAEKWQCTAMWINALYRQHLSGVPMECVGAAILGVKEALNSEINYNPCCICPIYADKCKKHWEPPQINFKIIEQFTGLDTIRGYDFPIN